jgi:hypothetical protein
MLRAGVLGGTASEVYFGTDYRARNGQYFVKGIAADSCTNYHAASGRDFVQGTFVPARRIRLSMGCTEVNEMNFDA